MCPGMGRLCREVDARRPNLEVKVCWRAETSVRSAMCSWIIECSLEIVVDKSVDLHLVGFESRSCGMFLSHGPIVGFKSHSNPLKYA